MVPERPFVLHVFVPSAAGGLDRVVEGLAVGYRRLGARVAVVALAYAEFPEPAALIRMRGAGVEVERVSIRRRAYVHEWRAAISVSRRLRPDIVHTHGVRADLVSGAAARFLRLPTVTTLHGRTGGSLKWRLIEWLQYRLVARFDAVVAVSQPQVDYLVKRGVPKDRVHLIPNAWTVSTSVLTREEARQQLGATDGLPIVAWVGRLSREKGPDVFVDALAQLRDLPMRVDVLGDGPEAASVQERARALGMQGRIHWHGIVPDAGRLFSAFDGFVLSSRTEGTPIALFEAMAAAVPVVTTAVGGVPAVVSQDHALLVPPEDPTALASGIRLLLEDRAGAKARAARALDRLNSAYGASAWFDRYGALYQQVASACHR